MKDNWLKVYTDGSCLENPGGPGGWAYIILWISDLDIVEKEFICFDSESNTTNNRMELTAVINALKQSGREYYKFEIYTDSKYVINCATHKWKINKNRDLWIQWENVSHGKVIKWHWVKAHNGNKYNELVDKKAFNIAKKLQTNLFSSFK